MRLNAENDARKALFVLLGVDLLFIVLHFVHIWTLYLPHLGFYIEGDRTFSEGFQYVKEFWLVMMFTRLSLITSERSYLAWVFLFGFLLLDDAFYLHELLGFEAAAYLGHQDIHLGEAVVLRGQDFGELVVYAVAGIVLLTLIQGAYYRGSDEFKRASHRLVTLLVLFVLFGVVLDVVHVALWQLPTLYQLVGALEDGGEMVMMSIICWYVLALLLRARRLPPTEAT